MRATTGTGVTADQRAAEKRAARLAQQALDVQAMQSEIAREIESARQQAAVLRAKHGAGRLGSLELGPLTLPNPGGGADLLDNASLTLVPGHRYGLLVGSEESRAERGITTHLLA